LRPSAGPQDGTQGQELTIGNRPHHRPVEPHGSAGRGASGAGPVKIIAVADTDSYLKWSAATLRAAPAHWSSLQLVVDSPIKPSAQQIRAADRDQVEVLGLAALRQRIRLEQPDIVLLACTGPVVAAVGASRVFRTRARPVLVTGLPGISIPATTRAVTTRAVCDLAILHSHREIAEFRALGSSLAPRLRFGLARLPFLPEPGSGPPPGPGARLVFAAQAKVPPQRVQREQVLRALSVTRSPLVKLRAVDGERQTHHEAWPYPVLMEDLVRRGELERKSVGFSGGAMGEALRDAYALATVSSTAALESIALDLPTLVLADFGVDASMINTVFEGSGCLGTLDDLRHGRIERADPQWREENYFHDASDNDWLDQLQDLLAMRQTGGLPAPRATGSVPVRIRRRIRLLRPAAAYARRRAVRARR
jgi:hypothetical protein